jgi:hypothetical protein
LASYLKTLFLAIFVLGAVPVRAAFYITFPSDVDWVMRSSEHFDILYPRGQDSLSERTLKAAEKAHKLLDPIFPRGPRRTWIVLANFSDSTNGYAVPFPWPHMVIFAAPPGPSDQLSSFDDWLQSVVLHEYVHIRHITPASGLWKVGRYIFGSWVVPNGLLPSHFHEGTAVLLESELLNGGRGTSPYFNMLKRMAVDSGAWGKTDFFPMYRLDGATTLWPGGTTAYFFGYELMHELWTRKGSKGIRDLTVAYSRNWPFLLDLPLIEVFGTNYSELWDLIFDRTRKETQKENAKITAQGLSSLNYLTESGFFKGHLAASPGGTLAAYKRGNPYDQVAIEIMDLRTSKVLKTIDDFGGSGEGLCWIGSGSHDILVFPEVQPALGKSSNGVRWYDVNDDIKRNIGLKDDDKPLDHVHLISCSPLSSRLLVYSETGGNGKVMELEFDFSPANNGDAKMLREWKVPSGQWVSSVLGGESMKDSHWIAVRSEGGTSLYRWNAIGDPVLVTKLNTHVFNLRHAPLRDRANDLYAIGTFDGRDEIWSLDLQHKKRTKRVSVLGGISSFDFTSTTDYAVTSYKHGGYEVALASQIDSPSVNFVDEIPKEVVRGPMEKESDISPPKEYSAFKTLIPTGWIPSLLIVPNGVQFGIWVPGFDIAQRHEYDFFGGYDTRGAPFLDGQYTYHFGGSFGINSEIWYLPTYLYSSNQFYTQWGARFLFTFRPAYWFPEVSFGPIFRRSEQSSLGASIQSLGFRLGLTYKLGLKARPVSISPVKGTKVYFSHDQYFRFMGSDDNFYSSILGVDQYLENPLVKEHVFYISLKGGLTAGTWFYNSFFDSGGELLFTNYRSLFLNRGFYPQTFLGRRMVNLNLEYRFPIARPEWGIALWPAHLMSISGAFIADATTYDLGESNYRDGFPTNQGAIFNYYYASIGTEIKTNWKFSYYVPADIRFGFYHSFGPFGMDLYFTCEAEATF